MHRHRAGPTRRPLVALTDGRFSSCVSRKGYGRVMLLRDGRVYGPIANLGFAYRLLYGHHDCMAARWSVGA